MIDPPLVSLQQAYVENGSLFIEDIKNIPNGYELLIYDPENNIAQTIEPQKKDMVLKDTVFKDSYVFVFRYTKNPEDTEKTMLYTYNTGQTCTAPKNLTPYYTKTICRVCEVDYYIVNGDKCILCNGSGEIKNGAFCEIECQENKIFNNEEKRCTECEGDKHANIEKTECRKIQALNINK